MSFFTGEHISAVTGGQWVRRPSPAALGAPLAGVGIDTRADLTSRAYFALKGDRHDGHAFAREAVRRGAALVIVECDTEVDAPETVGVLKVDDTRRALGRLALAYRRTFTTTKVIAITGSAGKTTTKRLVHGVLSNGLQGSCAPKSFNNEIGVPLTILAASPRDHYVVVEIGTNAPGEIGRLAALAEPDIAIITSIGRSHLERLGSLQGVAREKACILSHLREDGLALVTADAPTLQPYLKIAPSAITFGRSIDGDLRLTGRGRDNADRWWFEINARARFETALPGEHNAINAIAAVATGRRMGLTDDRIRAGLRTVQPEAMRFTPQRIARLNIFNDAYNANPESTAAALRTFSELTADAPRRVLILGNMLELGPESPALHAEIGQLILELHRTTPFDQVILIGELAAHIADALPSAWHPSRLRHYAQATADAIEDICDLLHPHDAVLIKASRGAALERIVNTLQARQAGLPESRREEWSCSDDIALAAQHHH